MKKISAYLAALFVLIILIVPVATANAGDTTFTGSIVPQCGGGPGETECNICHLEQLIQNLMRFAIFFAVLVATGLFAYAGILMLSAGGNQGQVEKAKSIFTNVLIGFIVLLDAFLVV